MTRTTNHRGLGRRLALTAALLLGTACYTGVDTMPAQPRSLAGVNVDGTLTSSSSGTFTFDAQARALFDHFLAAEGEVEDEALRARVRHEIDQRLRGPAADQAWEAFLGYLDYRQEASALLQDEATLALDADAIEAALAEIRARTIGEAPGVPDEGPRLRAALAWRATLTDRSLDPTQRAHRLAALQEQLGGTPDPQAPSRVLSRIHQALDPIPMNDVEARRTALTELVDEAAAERWLALERQRAEALTHRP